MATILMVDDDGDMVKAVKLVLEAHGHRVESAPNAEQGLRRIPEIGPDLIILDVMMDRYTEGFRFSQTLRSPDDDSPYREFREIPILVFSSIHRTTSFRFEPNTQLPVDAFLEKSASSQDLVATIDALLAGRTGAGASGVK